MQGCTPRMSWPFLLPYIMQKLDFGLIEKAFKGMENKDNWKHRSKGMACKTCMWFMLKAPIRFDHKELDADHMPKEVVNIGRCRRHAPTMSGWPVMFTNDWCGDHKLDETKI